MGYIRGCDSRGVNLMPIPAILIPGAQVALLDAWLRDNYPYLYGNDTGETEYWKSLDSAKFFIDDRVILGNANLSAEQKESLLVLSDEAYEACSTWWPFDAQDEVVCYYNAIAVSFPPVVGDSDPNINEILGLSTEGSVQAGAADVEGSSQLGVHEGESNIKIPWWGWILGAVGLYAVIKK